MITISNGAQDKLTGNYKVIGRLMVLFNVHSKTIERWIEGKDVRLTTPQALEIIKDETGLSDEEILEGESENAHVSNAA